MNFIRNFVLYLKTAIKTIPFTRDALRTSGETFNSLYEPQNHIMYCTDPQSSIKVDYTFM